MEYKQVETKDILSCTTGCRYTVYWTTNKQTGPDEQRKTELPTPGQCYYVTYLEVDHRLLPYPHRCVCLVRLMVRWNANEWQAKC